MTRVGMLWLVLVIGGGLAACATPPLAKDRFVVFFNEASTNLTPDARKTLADVTAQVHATGIARVRVEGWASATGSLEGNQRLSETRAQAVAAELERDGLDPKTFRQVFLGQTSADDPTVAARRVDVVLER